MMALAVSVQASIVPLTYSLPYAAAPLSYAQLPYAPLSYTARSLPLAYAAAPAPAIQYEYAPALRAYPEVQYSAVAELRSPAAIIPVAAEG